MLRFEDQGGEEFWINPAAVLAVKKPITCEEGVALIFSGGGRVFRGTVADAVTRIAAALGQPFEVGENPKPVPFRDLGYGGPLMPQPPHKE